MAERVVKEKVPAICRHTGCQRANLVSRSGEYSVTQALDVSDRSITPR